MMPLNSSGEKNSLISRLRMTTSYSNSKHHTIFLTLSVILLLSIAGGTFLTFNLMQSGSAHAAAPANTAVTSYKYNNGHTGLDANETILNTSNVNQSKFGRKISYPVDGQIYAQPLYIPNLTVNGATHNVVFVETENDSIYAFDADQTNSKQALWQVSLLTNGATAVPYTDASCNNIAPIVGITGTPVIDSTTNTMYVVSYTKENGSQIYRLHALDISTGQEKAGSPTVLQGSVAGTGSGSVNGKITFNSQYERQRAALMMENGNIYIAFASFCDNGPYHGWIMSYNAASLQQSAIYNSTANGVEGGIWAAGGPLVTDSDGNIYFISGNGDFNLSTTGGVNASDAIVKVSPQLKVLDYFSPFNQLCLEQTDADLGSGGILVVPGANEFIQSGKEGRIYVLSTAKLGKYTQDANLSCASTSTERKRTDIDQVVQELPPSTVGGVYTTPAYWNGNVYFTGANDHTKAFSFSSSTGLLSTAPTSQSAISSAYSGGGAIVSSNGTASGSAIVWTNNTQGLGQPGVLHAYDATDLSKELYNTNMDPGRDSLDSYVKFSAPIVANGEVFVPTAESLSIYGLLSTGTNQPTPTPITTPIASSTVPVNTTPTATPPATTGFNNIGISDDTQPGLGNLDNSHNSYSADAIRTYAGINEGDNTFYNGMVFTWPDTPSGTPDNYVPAGQTITVTPAGNANILGFLGSATGGLSYGKGTINYTDGSTQTFTLGFSDWTLSGGRVPVSFGNGKLATLLYRNTATSYQLVTNYIFYADVAMQAGKTVASVTLPKTTTGGTMHIFSISTKQGTITTNPTPTTPYNNIGTSDDTNMAAGKLDGKNSFSAQASQLAGLIPGASVNVDDTTFVWPAADPGQANNYQVSGQTIPVNPVNNVQTLALLGTATNGLSQGTATITYTDSTTQQFPLSFSDWTLFGSTIAPAAGDQIAVSMPYRNTPGGKQVMNAFVFETEVGLQSGKTIASVTLPGTTTGGQMHVFAVSTKADPANATKFNNAGISDDNNTGAGNSLDGKYSYSKQALQLVGLTPGSMYSVNGVNFVWPSGYAAQQNNYSAVGQVIPVNSGYGATTLAFLGSSVGGHASGTAIINYADGTTQTIQLGLSDWALGGGNLQPAFGNQVVATASYRDYPGGKQTLKNYVFYTEFSLSAYNEPIASVTLPNNSKMHIFAVATR